VTARVVRAIVLVVCVLGIAGMVVGSVTDKQGLSLTAGLVSASAVLSLMVATAVDRGAGDADEAPPDGR
jgi:hypothetical protein